jgi:phage gp45-like
MKSATRNGPAEHGDSVSSIVRELYGKVRRMAIGVTADLWQVIGHLLLDGKTEARDAEHFSGLGFYARPKAGSNPEAVVIFLGEGASSPTVVACRDEDVRRAVVGDLSEDETAMFNSSTVIICRSSGIVEIKAPGGVAEALATKADVQAVRDALHSHSHLYLAGPGSPVGVPSPTTGNPSVPAPAGTTILKGQ